MTSGVEALRGQRVVALRRCRDVDESRARVCDQLPEVRREVRGRTTLRQLLGHQQLGVADANDVTKPGSLDRQNMLVRDFPASDDGDTEPTQDGPRRESRN